MLHQQLKATSGAGARGRVMRCTAAAPTRLLAPRRRSSSGGDVARAQMRATAAAAVAPAAAARRPFPRARGGAIAAASAGESAQGAAAAATAVAAGGLRELTSADFYEFLEASADKLTVVDFYTDWCGPCKLIYPELVKLSEELGPKGGQIVKFNCNKENKDLGKALGIKVAPTFHLYRGRERVADMTGAKVDALRALIEQHLPGAGAN